MTSSKDRKDLGTIDRLEIWLASNPKIPLFRRRANIAAICRSAGIARSTADSNPTIRTLIARLDRVALAAKRSAPIPEPAPTFTVLENPHLPCTARSLPMDSNGQSLALEHLLKTGRVVR